MKLAEQLHPIEGLLAADFKSLQPRLQSLDKHLVLRTYLDGYQLSELDTKVWQALRGNKAVYFSLKKGALPNLARWFIFIEQYHPEIQEEIKAKESAADQARKAKIVAGSKAGASYALALQDTDAGVVTRFLPEPSGYLHIGHAKAALLSDYFAHVAYQGTLRLRLDDTNPSKEKAEYQDSIIEDLSLMGIIPDKFSFTSNYFDYLYHMCIRVIKEGHAYADDTPQETMQKERWDGIKSACRDRTVEENLRIFHEMSNGTEEGLKNCIRAKVSVDDPNKAMRDPVIYRCNVETPHHRTGTRWKVYPTYDFACPVVDSHEGVTHALRSTEYTDRNPLYQWFIDMMKIRQVHMWDFARMNFIRTFLSKRKLAKLVDTGKVWGWDDPRMPTIRGVRRRGMTIEALREFILKQGPSRNIVTMDWTVFWATNKKIIDPIAPRYTAILAKDAVPVRVTGAEAPAAPRNEARPKHPKNPAVGTKQVVFAPELLMDQADAASFAVGEEMTIMGWGNAFVREKVARTGEGAAIAGLTLELHLAGDFKKTDKKVTWLAAAGQQVLVRAELWEFADLITKDTLEEGDAVEDFLTPVSAVMEEAWCGEDARGLRRDDIVQLERRGYYRVDKGLDDWKEGDEGEKGPRIVFFGIPTGKTGAAKEGK